MRWAWCSVLANMCGRPNPASTSSCPQESKKLTKVKVRRVYKEEFGVSTRPEGDQRKFSPKTEDASVMLMLTGDLNVALVPWIVQYRIKDPYNFLFKVKDIRLLLMDMSEAAMRLVVGDRSVNEVISKREEIAIEARNILQEELDNAEAGINVVTIEMKRTNVPDPVQPSLTKSTRRCRKKKNHLSGKGRLQQGHSDSTRGGGPDHPGCRGVFPGSYQPRKRGCHTICRAVC